MWSFVQLRIAGELGSDSRIRLLGQHKSFATLNFKRPYWFYRPVRVLSHYIIHAYGVRGPLNDTKKDKLEKCYYQVFKTNYLDLGKADRPR
jgi:hypothetical protein